MNRANEQTMEPECGMNKRIDELTAQVVAAEMNLTHFAAKHGKESPVYQDSLKDFATAWYLLTKNREKTEFMHQVAAS